MHSRFTHWRQRLLDLAGLTIALLVVSRVEPRMPLTAMVESVTLLLWAVGLAFMGHYKEGEPTALLASASKLLLDHALLCVAWMGVLWLLGLKPEIGGILIFGGISFALLLLARVRFQRDRKGRSLLASAGPIIWDVVIGLGLFHAVNGLWWDLDVSSSLLATIILGRALAPNVAIFIKRPWVAWLVGEAVFAGLIVRAGQVLHWPQTSGQLLLGASLLPAFVGGVFRFVSARSPANEPDELWRRLALGAVALALLYPLFSARMMGASDAKLYAEAMQDFLGQLHVGIFPVFVSQTEIAPFGAVFPFRMAFYHFHFGALLDLLTWHSLNVYAVQHLTLILSALGGIFGLYAVLKRLAPALPWESAALAALYLACPAWLSTLYGLDMYFTAMTLPWLPLVIYSVSRTFADDCDLRDYLLLGAALAATWLAHPPVGFWAAVIVSVSQLLRLATAGRRPTGRELRGLSLAVCTCLLLCAGLFVSLAEIRVEGERMDPTAQVLASLSSVVPQVFKPVSAAADRLSDLQLGYAWQLLLALGVVLGLRGAKAKFWIFSGLTLGLLALIYPVPGLTPALWRTLPWEVTNITNVWPMQRLYPIVATLAAFIAIGAFRTVASPRLAPLRLTLLGLLCLWSGFEAAKFVRRGHTHTKPVEETRLYSKIENSPLLSSWTAYTPRLPSHPLAGAVNDPRLLNRLLDPQTKSEIVSNNRAATTALSSTPAVHAIVANAVAFTPGTMRITPGFFLEPGRRYQLTLSFSDYDYAGLLQIMPLNDYHPRFYREVPLPATKPTGPLTITVWTTETAPVPVDFRFIPAVSTEAKTARPHFFSYQLTPYQADALPIKISSLAPYVATVDAPRASLLETHRFFARGYRATVNGRTVPVTESPEHLAMLPLDAGKNEVRLDYVGPTAVRIAFWVSAVAWIALAGFAAWLVVQRWLARGPSSVQSLSS